MLLIFNSLGTPPNSAIQKYMNSKKVPQLFVATGATKWNDPKDFPWTMGWQPAYQSEGRIYAKYLLDTKPDAKIAVLFQNDDFGKDYVIGLKRGFGDKYAQFVVKDVSYEVSDPTVDSQIVSLQATGADTFVNVTTPKFAAQAIRKAYDIGWKPFQYVNNVSVSVSAVLQPAGLEKSIGLITAAYQKDPTDPKWTDDQGFKDWLAWMKKYYPDGNVADASNAYGYSVAMTLVQVLKQCGKDVTRENIMKQAANIKDLTLPMLLPGIKVSTSATDFSPIKQMQLARFDGKTWVLFGDVISS